METTTVTNDRPRRRGLRGVWRRIERFLVGLGMSIVAWPLERIVLRTSGQH